MQILNVLAFSKNNLINKKINNKISFKGVSEKDEVKLSSKVREEKEAQEAIWALKYKLWEVKKELEKTVFWVKQHELEVRAARLMDEIEAIKKHPKIAFLFLSKYTSEQKQEMMSQKGLMFVEDDDFEKVHLKSKAKTQLLADYEHLSSSFRGISREHCFELVILKPTNIITHPSLMGKNTVKWSEFSEINKNNKDLDFSFLCNVDEKTIQEIIDDRCSKKILTAEELAKKFKSEKLAIKTIPFVCKEYVSQNEKTIKTPFIDMENEQNKKYFERIYNIIPKKSKYHFSSVGPGNDKKIRIPVSYLAKLGFGSEEQLLELIRTKKIMGGVANKESEKIYYVTIDCSKTVDNNQTIREIEKLRNENPKIRTFEQFRKELKLKKEELRNAILEGEVDLIPVFLNPSDGQSKCIDVSIPKNKDFYEKTKTELEIRKQALIEQKETKKQERIEHLDYQQRMQSLRMKLVWNFMPKTREIASKLAQNDGYVCSLFAKMEDSKEELTTQEEIKIKSYYKELWLQAGVEEQKEAFKKTAHAIETYEQFGLEALDEEIKKIFEQYGFC